MMNFKRTCFWLLLFLSLSATAPAQQATKADLQALELKLTNQMTEMDSRLIKQINELDKRIIGLEIVVRELDKRIGSQMNMLFAAMSALIGVVLAVIALPQLLGYFQGKRERADLQKRMEGQEVETQKMIDALNTRIERQQQELERQRQEIQELKSRRIVTPS